MVFNRASKFIVETIGVVPTPSHDWWLYLLISGAGGKVFYDPNPLVLYRQHENSIVGENTSIANRFKRSLKIFYGDFKVWIDLNIKCSEMAENFLTKNSLESLIFLKNLRNMSLVDKILNLYSFGGFKFEAQRALVIDEKPLRVF